MQLLSREGKALYWSNSRLCLISWSVWLLLFACFPDPFTLKMVTVIFDKCQEIFIPLHSPIPKSQSNLKQRVFTRQVFLSFVHVNKLKATFILDSTANSNFRVEFNDFLNVGNFNLLT